MRKRQNGQSVGRRPKQDRGSIVRKNGYTVDQWNWLEAEARAKSMDTMTYVRQYPIQWWIDSVEASRAESLATPEQDKQFEALINKSSSKRSNSKRR